MTFPAGSASSLPWRLGPIRALACPCSSAMCQRLHHRVSEDLSRRRFLGGMAAMLAPFALPGTAASASDDRPLLLTNLRLFDGTGKPVRHGVQVLGQATGTNGALLALSGERNPYPGMLGRIAQGAWADLLVADGDPAVNLDFLADPGQHLRVIMKGGQIHKNTL